MTGVLPVVTEEADLQDEPMEVDLPWLHQQCMSIGRPAYIRHDDGAWSVTLNVPTGRAGITAKVSSRYDHGTLTEAMRDVLRKVEHGAPS